MGKIFLTIKNWFKNTIIPIFATIEWMNIPVSTYVRWIFAFILSINTFLITLGFNPLPYPTVETIYEIVSVILNIIILILNTYKNNSTSKEALIADKIMRALKAAPESTEEDMIRKLNNILTEINSEEDSSV